MSDGCSGLPLALLFRITLPLATPGLAASLLLVFAAAIEEYGTPAALGRRSGFDVLVTEIDLRISDWPIDLAGLPSFRWRSSACRWPPFWSSAGY